MTRPGNRSTSKAGFEPRSAALVADALTTPPKRRCEAGDYPEDRTHVNYTAKNSEVVTGFLHFVSFHA